MQLILELGFLLFQGIAVWTLSVIVYVWQRVLGGLNSNRIQSFEMRHGHLDRVNNLLWHMFHIELAPVTTFWVAFPWHESWAFQYNFVPPQAIAVFPMWNRSGSPFCHVLLVLQPECFTITLQDTFGIVEKIVGIYHHRCRVQVTPDKLEKLKHLFEAG